MLAGKLHWGEGKKKTQKGFARGFFGFSLGFFNDTCNIKIFRMSLAPPFKNDALCLVNPRFC